MIARAASNWHHISRAHLLPRRHGRFLRVGGRTVRSFVERQTGGSRRTPQRARRGLGGIVCGAQIRRAFGHAAAHRVQIVPASHLRGGPPDALSRVFGQGLRSAASLLAAGGDGVGGRGVSRYHRRRTPLRPSVEGRAPAARPHEGGHQSQLLHRHRRFAPGGEDRVRPGQTQRRAVGDSRAGSRPFSRRSMCAKCPASAR